MSIAKVLFARISGLQTELLENTHTANEGTDACVFWHGAFSKDGEPIYKVDKMILGVRGIFYMLWTNSMPAYQSLKFTTECGYNDCVNPKHYMRHGKLAFIPKIKPVVPTPLPDVLPPITQLEINQERALMIV